MARRVARAKTRLESVTPADTPGQTFTLLGLLWAGGTTRTIGRERTALLALRG